MTLPLTIADLKDLARRRVPTMFFDYADSGALTESTYRANEEDFGKIKFRQRVLVDMENRSLESTMIGQKVAMPVALAPTGSTGMQCADGEMLAARAAEEFGVPFTLSTMRNKSAMVLTAVYCCSGLGRSAMRWRGLNRCVRVRTGPFLPSG